MTVAVWFLIRDLLRGAPLLTPSILGQLLVLGNGHPDVIHADFGAAVLYTAVHFLSFLLFAGAVAVLARQAGRQPVVRFALLMLFVTFEFFFVVVVNSPAPQVRELFPLWTVLTANLLASATMGIYFWRAHPELVDILRREPLGA
jgi:hypothetical protein